MVRWEYVTLGPNKCRPKWVECGLFINRLSARVWIETTKESEDLGQKGEWVVTRT